MICVGAQQDLGLTKFAGWSLAGLLADESSAAPLNEDANGAFPSEGCGALLLKRLSDARRDGDKIHAVIRGIGAGFSESLHDAAQLAAERAFDSSQDVAPHEIAAVETVERS